MRIIKDALSPGNRKSKKEDQIGYDLIHYCIRQTVGKNTGFQDSVTRVYLKNKMK